MSYPNVPQETPNHGHNPEGTSQPMRRSRVGVSEDWSWEERPTKGDEEEDGHIQTAIRQRKRSNMVSVHSAQS
eukprot:CAMPEP_0206567804 /NCGR_PEP_ID=MMETSP0325_2-20121206/25469_1 /ASSEMBLY_ACC=CAM_ASM_000347 /TAXON_ID=2866 /ORGANISM="Crypthecodinium cohnii, Strain Seligo" /LENGTH=72 /DNA_ID=CAMNT_0054071089 /DNA_START=45 /DNA_END=260 /DNA_ORIENTATION=-